ncbi:DnaJ-domain-containing protein [Melanomma pulvis-pyrius CBS 109.77]|uniref:DnaJ-domain-containing protein n=1 Tax=Melanomma pulvis-pyrius CBS 109.77 TaxID=1314802 RepID=A0A6A6X617_9PLEO|nr:DnaJ-domain-containing protein [Melanomma pulvis-pyrius CBS 109.77]
MARRQRKERELKDEEFFDDEEQEMDDSPPSIDPYAVLGLETEATADEVKKAYRKLALKHHPDKAQDEDKTAANKKFQEIAFAYAVLSDDHRRKRYDLTGSTSETMDGDDDFDWLKFYRERFAELVTEENIKKTKTAYKGSAEEKRDLLNTYTKFQGRFTAIYQCVMLSDILEDDDRFRQILDEEIAKGTIDSYPEYERENNDASREKAKATERKRQEDFDKRQRKESKEAKNGKSKAKKNDDTDMSGLAAMIAQRQKSRSGGNFLDALEAKYAPEPRGKKRGTPDEPPEEIFAAAEERAKKARQSRRPAKAKVVDEDLDAMLEEEDIEETGDEEEEAPPPKKRGRLLRGRAKA